MGGKLSSGSALFLNARSNLFVFFDTLFQCKCVSPQIFMCVPYPFLSKGLIANTQSNRNTKIVGQVEEKNLSSGAMNEIHKFKRSYYILRKRFLLYIFFILYFQLSTQEPVIFDQKSLLESCSNAYMYFKFVVLYFFWPLRQSLERHKNSWILGSKTDLPPPIDYAPPNQLRKKEKKKNIYETKNTLKC